MVVGGGGCLGGVVEIFLVIIIDLEGVLVGGGVLVVEGVLGGEGVLVVEEGLKD